MKVNYKRVKLYNHLIPPPPYTFNMAIAPFYKSHYEIYNKNHNKIKISSYPKSLAYTPLKYYIVKIIS